GQGKKNGSVFRRVLWRLRNAGQFGERSRGSLDFVVQSFWLITFSSAFGTSDVSAVSAEQHAHMHLVGLAFQPPEKAAHAVPAIVCVIFVGIIRPRFLAFDDEVLVGLWQLVEWDVDVDLFARACPQQILLRFANSAPPETQTAPFLILRLRSGIALFKSMAMVRPNPRHSGQALSGLLKLNSPGAGGRMSRSQYAQCQPVENGISDGSPRTPDRSE